MDPRFSASLAKVMFPCIRVKYNNKHDVVPLDRMCLFLRCNYLLHKMSIIKKNENCVF